MNDEFENALAWFTAAPSRWVTSAKKDLTACAEWIWEVLQGDFNDNQTTAQVAVGTVISMIPLVDQICDVRDVIANCKRINSEPDGNRHWIALGLTLIGLFPSLGSLAKGCGKVMFGYLRKAGYRTGASTQLAKCIDGAVASLNKFLARPEVRKTLKALRIDNPYKYMAIQVRLLSTKINVTALRESLGKIVNAARELLGHVQKWGGDSLAQRSRILMNQIENVVRYPNKKFEEIIRPLQEMLNQLARRLDVEADMAHRAHLNTINPHAFAKITGPAEEAEFQHAIPAWGKAGNGLTYTGKSTAPPTPPGWTSTAVSATRGKHPLDNAHKTFHTMNPVVIPPGTKLYRVVDPTSSDNSICWMSEAEFLKLKSKDEWRKNFAVWASWNSNGEFVTYIVPPGKGLHVWEGITASQKMDKADFVLEGGAIQIVVNPADLDKRFIGKRQTTNWPGGYSDFGKTSSFVGVPVLRNNWYEKK